VFGLMSRKIMRLAKKRDVAYSFLFARPDGAQLAEIGKLLETERIRPVIDKVFPFEQAKEALRRHLPRPGARQGQGRQVKIPDTLRRPLCA
jgi:NADPH:quinone reductase-like Zn-dependent oxidoreductase